MINMAAGLYIESNFLHDDILQTLSDIEGLIQSPR